jgi:hypothetical protein
LAWALTKLFYIEGELSEKVDSFRYLGRILAQDNNSVWAVRSQIKKARGIWTRVGQVVQADNTPWKVSAKFYKAVVQSILLYGSKVYKPINDCTGAVGGVPYPRSIPYG